jgi:putative transferase (TIGR04331 family)
LLPQSDRESQWNQQILIGAWLDPLGQSSMKETKIDLVPYHWDNREKLKLDVEQIRSAIPSILRILSQDLNLHHGTKHPIEYWEVLIGEWLYLYCQVLFDRYSVVKDAQQSFPNAIFQNGDYEENQIPYQTLDFQKLSGTDHVWNANLFQEVESFISGNLSYVDRASRKIGLIFDEDAISPRLSFSLKNYAKRVTLKLLSKTHISIISTSYLRKQDLIKLCLRIKGIPSFTNRPNLSKFHEPRSQSFTLTCKEMTGNDFQSLAMALIPLYLPSVYLENYQYLELMSRLNYGTHTPKYIVTANSHFSDEAWKIWAAYSKINGSRITVLQHGGHYGLSQFSLIQDYEMSICDRFLTWGWDENNPKIFSSRANKLIKSITKKKRENLLIVTFESPLYANWLASFPIGPQVIRTLPPVFDLINKLSNDSKEFLRVRPYHTDYGLNQNSRLSKLIGASRVSGRETTFIEELSRAKLMICNYNSTTFLEGLRYDIPTILIIDSYYWEVNESYRLIIDEMRASGMIHGSSMEASTFIEAHFSKIDAWWESTAIRDVRKRFLREFGHVGESPVSAISRQIKS